MTRPSAASTFLRSRRCRPGERIEAVRAKTGFVPNGHRVRNILAVVQALANQTDHSRTVRSFARRWSGACRPWRAHSLVLDADWPGADLKWLVEQALQAYRVDRPDVVEVEGESVPLSPNQGTGSV